MLNLRNLRGGDCCRSQNGCCRHRACRVNRPANDGMGGGSGNMGNVENVKRVVFVGNPNVGKSSMFNALLGARTRTMNAPGTTVSITCGQYRYKSSKTTKNPQNWQFVDTPGTYSLSPMSPDEQVAVDALTGASGMPVPDLAVVVLDATALSRSLYLLSMVVELGLPTVVAITMNDLAVRNGCGVDAERLSHLLDGMPVVAIDGRTGDGGKALADAIAASFEGTPVPHGLTALPTATADADMKTADGLSVWAESRADARLDWTAGILRGLDMHAVDHVTLSDRIDRVLLHPVIGVLVFLAVLFVVFQATTTLASPMQDWIDVTFRGWCTDGLDLLLGLFGPSVSGGWLRSLLVDGLLDGVVTVLTFIPVMGIMFLLLSILEDSGYMARAAFVMDRAMRALGLDGRAFLPIIVGFGRHTNPIRFPATGAYRHAGAVRGMFRATIGVFGARPRVLPEIRRSRGLPHVRGFGHGHPVGRRAAAPHHVPRPRTRTVDAGASRIPMPARVAAGTFGAAASMGLHPWSQRDHHFNDHGAVAAAGHSGNRQRRRFRSCRRRA